MISKKFTVGLLLVIIVPTLEDREIDVQCLGTIDLPQQMVTQCVVRWNVLSFHVGDDLNPSMEELIHLFVTTILQLVDVTGIEQYFIFRCCSENDLIPLLISPCPSGNSLLFPELDFSV